MLAVEIVHAQCSCASPISLQNNQRHHMRGRWRQAAAGRRRHLNFFLGGAGTPISKLGSGCARPPAKLSGTQVTYMSGYTATHWATIQKSQYSLSKGAGRHVAADLAAGSAASLPRPLWRRAAPHRRHHPAAAPVHPGPVVQAKGLGRPERPAAPPTATRRGLAI